MNKEFFLQNLWRWKCGLEEKESNVVTIEELRKTEWCAKFEQLMRNRLLMGYFRYGHLGGDFKPQWDRLSSCRARLDGYEETGNTELLVDVANMCLLEFVEGKHPLKHFEADNTRKYQAKVKGE